MLGDSLTFRNNWNQMLNRQDIINLGADGETTYGIYYRLESIELEGVSSICLMIGINDLLQEENLEAVYQRYEMIVNYFTQEKLRIIIQAILYVTQDTFESHIINDEVDIINKKLQNLAKRENFDFLDLNPYLSDSGALEAIYSIDGVHLKANAYKVWSTYLNRLLQ